MTRAGTGGARFPGFSASLSASYLLELAIIAASYFGIAKTALLVPAINATAMPLRPPTGVALSVILLRGNRAWPAILIGSIFATAITSSPMALWESDSNAIATTVAALAGAWLINRWSQGYKTLASPLNVARFGLCPDRRDQFRDRHSGPRSCRCFRLRRLACHFNRYLGKVVAHGRGGDCDHCSCHFALGDDATASTS